MQLFFLFFAISGFCTLVYQVVWLRIAMANFGVTSISVSIILSVFMAGLALGSWGGGRLTDRLHAGTARTFLRYYAAAEAVIGLSGLVVAPLLGLGHTVLTQASSAAWGSSGYYVASAVLITLALLPFCTCMGATFPLAMAAVRAAFAEKSLTSFSYLYVANVFGAMVGGLCSAFVLIELFGFRHTMLVAAGLNLLVALLAILLSCRAEHGGKPADVAPVSDAARLPLFDQPLYLVLLFVTGLVSLAMEVIWTRQFVPVLGPVVYTFAIILATYLGATLVGSRIYRGWFMNHPALASGQGWQFLTILSAGASLLPLVVTDYRVPLAGGLMSGIARVVVGIGPFCALLGFLTPALLDRISAGNPRRAGVAYAINTLGCIVGPLVAGFLLLPQSGEKWSLTLLALPLFAIGLFPGWSRSGGAVGGGSAVRFRGAIAALLLMSVALIAGTKNFEHVYDQGIVLRDHTATVIAGGVGMSKLLLVNGTGMTKLTPITKTMVHLPLASLENSPRKGLVLCLGMGTSFRSMISWGISATVVELVPSIPSLLPFFHGDGKELLSAGTIVVDDARRFLERSQEAFSVIVVDPPPPMEAAASSLLHSKEFYAVAVQRLAPDGILQQWIPWNAGGVEEKLLLVAMTKALVANFPYVRAFRSLEGWGFHFLASRKPIPRRTAAEMAALMPARAAADFVEWGPQGKSVDQFEEILSQEVPIEEILAVYPDAPVLSDDRPLNEYFLLRHLFQAGT